MNSPLFNTTTRAHHGWLRVFAVFHLNLAFSSIEEERRSEVVEKCYWPLLQLAQVHPHIGIELSGYTLRQIHNLCPDWVKAARELIAVNKIELIGSGYTQMIGPLVPPEVVAKNLELGNKCYRGLLGTQPAVALVNEQAFSGGLIQHYLDADYQALLMDWDNPHSNHPDWNTELQFLPQRASGPDGREIAVLWTNTAAFQQFQRFVYDDISLESYLRFVRSRRALSTRALCIYGSDAEIFDFRPGRFRTESQLPKASEWSRINEAFSAVTSEIGINLIGPSHALKLINREGGGNTLRLESAVCPVPVKKQPKYNLARWATTGRDNTAINGACERVLRGMQAGSPFSGDWEELCYLWASDFRTHITTKRWTDYCARLEAAERKWSIPPTYQILRPQTEPLMQRYVNIETKYINARLDRRRGLAVTSLRFEKDERAIIGSLPHGYFSDIELQADWYTGDCVFEEPGEHKVTDLEWCEAHTEKHANGDILVHSQIDTPKGIIEKSLLFSGSSPRIEFNITFHWDDWGPGVLRLGHITLLPEAFEPAELSLTTCNGGAPERFLLAGEEIDHGAPVSYLVSSSHGFGMTDGWVEIGDASTKLRVEVDRCVAPLLGLLTHRPAMRPGGAPSIFCQLQLSALELDDTRKPLAYRNEPRRFRFAISSVPHQ